MKALKPFSGPSPPDWDPSPQGPTHFCRYGSLHVPRWGPCWTARRAGLPRRSPHFARLTSAASLTVTVATRRWSTSSSISPAPSPPCPPAVFDPGAGSVAIKLAVRGGGCDAGNDDGYCYKTGLAGNGGLLYELHCGGKKLRSTESVGSALQPPSEPPPPFVTEWTDFMMTNPCPPMIMTRAIQFISTVEWLSFD